MNASADMVTLLFSDIEGSTKIIERLGDDRAYEVIRQHHSIVRAELKAHGGNEVELLGDGFLMSFESPDHGLACGIAIQRRLAAFNQSHPDVPIRVRMGLHTGETIRDDSNKFFGKTVIIAARIAKHARGGEILVSAALRRLTEASSRFAFGGIRRLELKGLAGQHGVCAVGWSDPLPEARAEWRRVIARMAGKLWRKRADFFAPALDRGASSTVAAGA
jgi:class 3 adenylate cyclase